MTKKIQKNSKKTPIGHWLAIGLFANLLFLPSGIFIKLITNEVDPAVFTAVRYSVAFLALLPFVISGIKKHRKLFLKKLPVILVISVVSAITPVLNATALSIANVSFVAVLELFAPIVFAIIAFIIIKEKVSRNSVIGILFAALGGMAIFVLPTLIGSGGVITFGWLPVILCAIVVVMNSIWQVYLRKIHEEGLPLLVLTGISFMFASLASIGVMLSSSVSEAFFGLGELSIDGWLMILYLAIVASGFARFLTVRSHEKLGTATQTTIIYLHYAASIILPIIILGETMSFEMIIGTILILVGIIFTRMHYRKHHFHHIGGHH